GREDDFFGIAADECGKMLASVLDRFVSGAAQSVTARWVAVLFGEKRQHRLLNSGGDRSGRVVIEIELSHAAASKATDRRDAVSLRGSRGMCQGGGRRRTARL